MFADILRQLLGGQVIFIAAEWVFNFFRNNFKTGQYIKDKGHDRNGKITQRKYKADRQGHYIKEDEFFDEYTVGKRDRCILDAFAGAADIGKGLELAVENNQLVAADLTFRMQPV